jgi:hypothetical protein
MSKSRSTPPARRLSFTGRDDEIDYLGEQLVYWFWRPHKSRAMYYAERLATLLDDSSSDSVMRYCEEWIVIWEVRGNTHKALNLASLKIEQLRKELEAAQVEHRRRSWFVDDIRTLQDALFLQAERHLRLGDRASAIELLTEASALAERFGIELDAQAPTLLADLQRGYA